MPAFSRYFARRRCSSALTSGARAVAVLASVALASGARVVVVLLASVALASGAGVAVAAGVWVIIA